MRLGLAAFTREGEHLVQRLQKNHVHEDDNDSVVVFDRETMNARTWVKEVFHECDALVFVGATGIAVRLIAPHIVAKDTDPAVIVLDEQGRYVIPLLSGHIGGANRLACELARLLGAEAVITTATDIQGIFAVDVWSVEQGCVIDDVSLIKYVSARLLQGEKVGFMSDFPVEGALPSGLIPVPAEQPAQQETGGQEKKQAAGQVMDRAMGQVMDLAVAGQAPEIFLPESSMPEIQVAESILPDNVVPEGFMAEHRVPETPDVPATLRAALGQGAADTPDVPEAPHPPGSPSIPDLPGTPDFYGAPDTPGTPDTLDTSNALSAPDSLPVGILVSLDTAKRPFPITLQVVPKIVIAGAGCRKGVSSEVFEAFVLDVLREFHIPLAALATLASIDLKKGEKCLTDFSVKYALDFVTFPAAALNSVPGTFSPSPFVREVTGVDNVCERSAMAAGGGRLLLSKTVKNGMTLALAVPSWVCRFPS